VELPKARKIPTVKRHECRAPPAFLNQPWASESGERLRAVVAAAILAAVEGGILPPGSGFEAGRVAQMPALSPPGRTRPP